MASELDENLITFTCRFGTYKHKVMPFRLCGAPKSFQQFMNNNFNEFQEFMSCYINDLLVFSKTKKEHTKHVLMVLKRLGEMKLNVNILKSEFYIQEVKFLGLIITPHGIKMDPKKVEQIKNWMKSKDIRGI